MPSGKLLTATVRALDAKLFAAYNHCDLAAFAHYLAPGIQFYHDKSGFSLGRSKLVAAIKNNICGKLHRALIPGTFHVYPIPRYGALETGADRFCELRTGNCNFFSKFAQLWQYRRGKWLLTIVFSYNHHAGSRTGAHAGSPRSRSRSIPAAVTPRTH